MSTKKRASGKKGNNRAIRGWLLIGGTAIVGGLMVVVSGFYVLIFPNINKAVSEYELLLPKSADFNFLVQHLESEKVLKNSGTFWWASRAMGFQAQVKPGRYLLKQGMTNRQIIQKLRAGLQDPVKVRFRARRNLFEIAKDLAPRLELEEKELLEAFENKTLLDTLQLEPNQVISIFIPDTYYFYWNVSGEEVIRKMKREFDAYWNEIRNQKASEKGLSPNEVMALASIVQAESNKDKERPTIAGVYLNRIRKGMRLEADPTVIFAHGDFTIRRVLKRHLEIDSPYNTYKYAGLPPGPINNPEKSAIEAVLNAENHTYIFFCAKSDMSGFHTFTSNLTDHNRAAHGYHNALNNRKK